ncbi:putative F-box protein At2g36090 [Tasmannia lanceolata]|uniref:putative F-box protein At2g36090 n=1 Tax=Tasmannia lanceolata TaxID=3420 RepID=UPI004063FFF8
MASKSTAYIDGETSTTTISSLHPDILNNILRRLDGPTLASVTCATSHLHTLSSHHHHLWRDLCHATWPSTSHQSLSTLISTFPKGFHSFFSDSFPNISSPPPRVIHLLPHHLISAVDLHDQKNLLLSKILHTETLTTWFFSSPFRLDALDRREKPVNSSGDKSGDICRRLAEDLTLTWILIDPVRRRAVNLSSRRPVSVQRHWFSGEILVRFATILNRFCEDEPVQCGIVVRCEGCEKGEGVDVREVSLQVEDMEGINLNGKESLGILQRAMEGERRGKVGKKEKERYLEYLNRKRERKEKKMKKEGMLDLVCIFVGVSIFVAFLFLVLFR